MPFCLARHTIGSMPMRPMKTERGLAREIHDTVGEMDKPAEREVSIGNSYLPDALIHLTITLPDVRP